VRRRELGGNCQKDTYRECSGRKGRIGKEGRNDKGDKKGDGRKREWR